MFQAMTARSRLRSRSSTPRPPFPRPRKSGARIDSPSLACWRVTKRCLIRAWTWRNRSRPSWRFHRLGHRRSLHHRGTAQNPAQQGAWTPVTLHDPHAHPEHGFGDVFDVLQAPRPNVATARPAPLHPCPGRGLAHPQNGRCQGHVRRHRGDHRPARHWRLLRHEGHEHPQ